ncbi:hypothetical protein ACGVWS_15160 [Enterobacteriaceae bacterium LUAb1]
MKVYLSLFLSTAISTIYTILVFFSIVGFERNGILDKFTSHMRIDSMGFFLVSILVLCVVMNISLTFFLVKKKWQKKVSSLLYISFVCGCFFMLIIIKIPMISDFLFNLYIDMFCQGTHYVGEDKAQQVISYIPRIMAFSFITGGILSYALVMVKKIKLKN